MKKGFFLWSGKRLYLFARMFIFYKQTVKINVIGNHTPFEIGRLTELNLNYSHMCVKFLNWNLLQLENTGDLVL